MSHDHLVAHGLVLKLIMRSLEVSTTISFEDAQAAALRLMERVDYKKEERSVEEMLSELALLHAFLPYSQDEQVEVGLLRGRIEAFLSRRGVSFLFAEAHDRAGELVMEFNPAVQPPEPHHLPSFPTVVRRRGLPKARSVVRIMVPTDEIIH